MQIRVVTVTVLVLAALWGCGGGAVDARAPSTAATDPNPARLEVYVHLLSKSE